MPIVRATARLVGFSRSMDLAGPIVGLSKQACRGIVLPGEWTSLHRSLFERGTLVVFYLSRKDGGRGEAAGIGRVTSFGSDLPENLRSTLLLRQGVLGLDDLVSMRSRSGEVCYFTFDTFMPFTRPVSYAELVELGCVDGLNLVTSQALGFDQLVSLVERASGMEKPQ